MIETPIGEALHRLLHAYKRAMREAYRDIGIELAIAHIRTLKLIHQFQASTGAPCTAQAIAIRLERDKAQIARLVKDLLSAELIEKQSNPDDGRSQLLTVTHHGEAMLERIRMAERQASQRMAAGLSNEELTTFIRLGNTMTANLGEPEGRRQSSKSIPQEK
ncbi:MarR family transcriptional regulator [Marinobacterium sp. D7]|uniref:MarR family winged helix-turn-helix transcriptional regulator n=1 Tax=Marinobacterium ramblicola TaxID=2849041 RepID=UPI001C2CF47C|nr:MarR family transcriptional regulator [Marinobacterium ramblicola]MBV1788717.1 MarR family transcriptional regulator [Marinobacterium ramblicola]